MSDIWTSGKCKLKLKWNSTIALQEWLNKKYTDIIKCWWESKAVEIHIICFRECEMMCLHQITVCNYHKDENTPLWLDPKFAYLP